MPENAKIKQIQIDSTTYDIEPAAQAEGTAVTVVTGISGGAVNKTTRYLHKTTTAVAPNAHTHSVTVTGTSGAPGGTTPSTSVATGTHTHSVTLTANSSSADGRITYIESHTGASLGTPTSATAAPNAHTHSVTVSGTTGANSGDAVTVINSIAGNSTSATGDIPYISGHTNASLGNPSTATAAPNAHSHSFTATGTVSLGSNSTSTNGVVYVESINSTAASGSPTNSYLHPTTNTVAPNAHTHSITISGTTGANSGSAVKAFTKLEGNTTSATGDVPYISAHTNASLGTPTSATAAPNAHTHSVTVSGTTSKNSDSATVLSSIVGNSTSATGDVPYISAHTNASLGTPSSATAAPNAHTHSVTVSGTTGKNSGDGVGVLTGLTGNNASGDIAYLSGHTAASLGTPTSSTAAPNAHTHSVTATGSVSLGSNSTSTNGIAYIESISGGSAVSPTTKYMKFSAGTTPKSGATPNHTSTATSSNSDSETVNTSSHTHAVTLTSSTASSGQGSKVYVESIDGNSPVLTGTTTFVTNRGTFTAGSGSFSATRTTAGSGTSARRTLTFSHSHTASSLSAQSTASVGIAMGTYTATYKYLTAATSASSSTVNVAKNTHTHNYDKTTSVSLTDGTAPSINFNTGTNTDTPYISAVSGGSAVSPTTKYFHPSFTGTKATTDANSGTGIAAITGYPNFSGGGATTKYLTKSTGTAAPNEHTHGYGSSTPLATGTNSGTGITAITGYPSFNGGGATTKYFHVETTTVASNEHTHSYGSSTVLTTSANNGTGITAITGYPNFSGGGATTKYLHPTTTDAAPNSHTHSYGQSAAIATGTNSGTGIDAITALAGNSTSASGDIQYISSYTVSGGTATANVKYFHPSFSGTKTTTGANDGTGIDAVTGYPAFSGGGSTTKYLHAGTTSAAPNEHTHSYGSSTVLTTSGNSGSGITAITGYPNFSGGSGTPKYLSASTGAPSATINVASTTHTHSYGSSAVLTTGANSGSGVDAITGLAANTSSASGDITYLENVTHTNAAVSSTANVIKAE